MKHILSRKAILLPLILIVLQSTAQQTYYVKHDGNDALDGHTIATAWASPEKVDSTVFNAGDSILFEGGFSFRGMLTLPHANSGTSSNPIVLSSYGGPMATINGGDSLGLYVQNVAGMVVKKLIFTTSSPLTNATDGLSFFMDQATNLDYILIDSVEVSGFGGNGITVGNGGAGGYSNVSIMHSLAHDNKGNAGISTYSNLNNFANTNIHVAYCKSYNNTGKPGGAPLTDASTGSGITIGGVTGATVEYCVAYNNGQNNNAINGGPVGIWTYESKNVIIQYCESYKNFAGSTVDGGGFDIDGGTQNCIVQYCYSHGNEGAGFAFFQYNAPDIFSNNVIRYNISENDGRKNNYGAISLWGYDGTHQITNSAVYNNTIYVDDVTLIINGVPEAVQLVSTNMTNIEIANNIFYVAGTLKLVNSPNPPPTTAGILFQNNDYYAPSGFNIAWGATSITDLNTWRTSPTSSGQEMNGGSPVGTTGNPLLTGPLGAGTIINPSDTANHLDSLSAYKIQSGSAAIDAGTTLSGMGTHDFFNLVIPNGAVYDIGANEFGSVPLPVKLYSFSGFVTSDHSVLNWKVGVEDNVSGYEIQRSADGAHFKAIGFVAAKGSSEYNYSDYDFLSANAPYYRIRIVDKDGTYAYSTIIKLGMAVQQSNVYAYQQGSVLYIKISSPKEVLLDMSAYDVKGRSVIVRKLKVDKGDNTFAIPEASQWTKGLYFLHISGDNMKVLKFMKD